MEYQPAARQGSGPRFSRTKFRPPEVGEISVERPELVARVAEGAAHGLCVVVAPAGAGKTTLLQQWLASAPPASACWVSVDDGDGDPTRFWGAVIEAVSGVRPDFAGDRRPVGGRGRVDADDLEWLVEVFEVLDPPATLILDDLHLAGSGIDSSLARVLRRRPRGLRVVLASRAVPGIDLDRLRAIGRVAEVGEVDLRLAPSQVWEVLATLGFIASDADLALVMEQTEGWAAGVILAGEALSESPDPTLALQSLADSTDAISHYLTTQVFDPQPPEVRDFLLATCVVDELTPDLAGVLTGGAGISVVDAAVAQVMLTRRSGSELVFGYNPMLAEALRSRLVGQDPQRYRALHLAAARWYEDRGDLPASFRHLWRAGERVEALTLLDRGVYDAYLHDHLPAVDAGALTLADRDIRAAPVASVRFALALAMRDHPEQAADLLFRVATVAADVLTDVGMAELLATRALFAARRVDMEATVRFVDAAEVHAGRCGLAGEGLDAARTMAIRAHAWAGDWAAAERVAASIDLDRATPTIAIEMHGALANLKYFRGNLAACQDHAQRALDHLAGAGPEDREVSSPAVALLGSVLLERNEVQRAEALLLGLVQDGRQVRLPARLIADHALARVWTARGEADRAALLLEESLDRLSHLPESSWAVARVRSALAQVELVGGDLGRSAGHAAHIPEGSARSLAQARLSLARGRIPEARASLADAATLADCARTELEVALVRVATALAAGEPPGAHAAAAVDLASRHGAVFPLAEARGPVFSAIQDQCRRRPRSSFVEAVLRCIPHVAPTRGPVGRGLEPLTERELAVLRYMATSMSYREVADELFVSVNTIKTHVRHVIRKLGAATREDALANARARGYL